MQVYDYISIQEKARDEFYRNIHRSEDPQVLELGTVSWMGNPLSCRKGIVPAGWCIEPCPPFSDFEITYILNVNKNTFQLETCLIFLYKRIFGRRYIST
jgi:hypothetical protein